MSKLKLFTVVFAVCIAAAAAIVTSDCETVLPTICKLNGAGSHCHPCVASAYIECSNDSNPQLKGCQSGHLWDALLSQCKPDSWVQPRHTKCEAGKTIHLPQGFRVTAESAAAVAAMVAALDPSQSKQSSWQTIVSRTNAAVQGLAKLARKTQTLSQAQQQQQQQQQHADGAAVASTAMNTPARTLALVPRAKSSGDTAARAAAAAGPAASIDEAKMLQLQSTVQGVQALRAKAVNLTAEANRAEELASQQVQAVQAALDSATDVESVVPELQQRVLVAETARQAAQSMRDRAEALLRTAEAQAAAAAAEIATLAASATLAVSHMKGSGEAGAGAAADMGSFMGIVPPALSTFSAASAVNDTARTLDRTLANQQQQQQQQQTLGSLNFEEAGNPGRSVAEGLDADGMEDDSIVFDTGTAGKDPYTMKLAQDFAAAAGQMVQGLAKETASRKADSHVSVVGGSVKSNNIMSSFVGLQHSITSSSSSGSSSSNNNNNILSHDQAQPNAEERSSNSARSEGEAAADEALAGDLGRKIALEAAMGSDWDFSALFRVDEGSPRGQPVEDQLSNAGSDIAEARVRQERQQEQEGQQRWPQEQERQQEQQEQRRPAQQQQKDHAVREQPTSHLHTNAARNSAVVLQSVKLSVRFHEALVRAASERVAASSALITQLPGAQTEAHISQLAEWFYSVLSALTEEGRAVVLGIRPDAAFSVNVAAGAPVVSLRRELTAVLRSADASELGDILTLQVQDVSEGLLQLVKVYGRTNGSKDAVHEDRRTAPGTGAPSQQQRLTQRDSQQLQEPIDVQHVPQSLSDGASMQGGSLSHSSDSLGPSHTPPNTAGPQRQYTAAASDGVHHAPTSRLPSDGTKLQRLPGNNSQGGADASHTTVVQPATFKQQTVARPLAQTQLQQQHQQHQHQQLPQQQQQQQPVQTIAKVQPQKAPALLTPAPLLKPLLVPQPAAAAAAAASDDSLLEAMVAKEFESFTSVDDTMIAPATAAPMAAAPLKDISKPSKVKPPPAAAAGAAVGAAKGPARVDPVSRLLSKTQPQIMTLMAVEVPMVVKPVHATQGL